MNKITRRSFLETSTALAATAALPFSVLSPKEKPLGVQLWSVREDMTEDPEKTLKGLAKIGFNYVEGFSNPSANQGYVKGKIFGKSIIEFKKMLKEYELRMTSGHVGFSSKDFDATKKDISDDWKKNVEDAVKLGQRFIIVPSWDNSIKTNDEVKKFSDGLNIAGQYCQTQNIRFGYHNHWFEFEKLGDELIYTTLLKNTNPELVTFEMDLCWAVASKQDPVEWFKNYPGRFELVHLKDLDESDNRKSVIFGTGKVDFPNILENMKKGGVRQLILELENYEKSPLEDLKVCYKNAHKLIKSLM